MQPISVPLKIIWVGEHAVCYDKKAVGQTLPDLNLTLEFNNGSYKDVNPDFVGIFIERFWDLCEADLLGFNRSQLPEFKVVTPAPFGAGLGTSAALAVALAQLAAKFIEISEQLKLGDVIKKSENGIHVKASGVDQYLVCQREGVHVYQAGEGRIMLKSFPYPFVVLNSGGSSSTGQMVNLIQQRWNRERSKVFNVIRKIGHISYEFIKFLRGGDYLDIYDCLIKTQDLLNNLGVVEERVQEFCEHLRTFKIAAKVTGAGGTLNGSGAILVCYQNGDQYSQVRRLAEQYGYDLVYKAQHHEHGYS